MKMLLNSEKNGVELHFDDRPADDTLSALRSAGFRWHRTGQFWYARQSEATVALARALTAGALEEIAATPAPSRPGKRACSLRYTFSGYYAPDGTYTKASYSFHERNVLTGHYCITVFTDSYGPVPAPAGVEVVNDSDSQRDYFEHTRWIISPDHPDYLGVFSAMEAAEAHQEKCQRRRDQKRGGPRTVEDEIAHQMRVFGYSRARAAENVQRDRETAERRRAEIAAARAEAKALAQAVQSARDSGDGEALNSALAELRERTAAFTAKVQAENHAKALASNLTIIERGRARGECAVLEGVAFLEQTHSYQELLQHARKTVFSLIAFDAVTGERLGAGEYDSPEARSAAKAEILSGRHRA